MNPRRTPRRLEKERRTGEEAARAAPRGAGWVARWNLAAGRWGVGLVAALFVSLAVMVPSDAAGQGIGLLVTVFALFALVLWALWACVAPRAPWRWTWCDVLVGGLQVWIGASAWIMANQGSPRQTINVFWIWVTLTTAYWLARQFLRTAEDCRALVALMLAVTVIQASFAMYQAVVVRPRERALYDADPEAALRAAGLVAPPDSPLRAHFAARIRDTEPTGTFVLTNSLAGFLAPWLTLAVAIGLASWRASGEPGNVAPARLVPQRLDWWFGGAAFLLVIVCLLLTKSRSAYLATLGGVGLLAVVAARRRWRIPGWWWGVAALGLTALAAAAAARGFLDRDLLTGARRSLGVRWEYWQATWALTLDHPWWGCGVGNFQNYYAGYMLPQASEVVADPHNWLFEMASSAGWPAAALLVGFLLGVAAWLAAPLLRTDGGATASHGQNASQSHGPFGEANAGTTVEGTPSARRWSDVGFGLGLLLALAASLLSGFAVEAVLLLVAMPLGAVSVWRLQAWVRGGVLPAWAMGVALLVLLVNLSAAGSLAFGGVAGTLWLLAACGLRLRELETAGNAGQPTGQGGPARWRACGALVVAGGLLVACIVTAYRPVVLGGLEMQLGDVREQSREIAAAGAAYEAAAAHDPWSFEPWQRLARPRAAAVVRMPSSEATWQELEQAVAESLRRNVRSPTLRRELSELYLALWRQTDAPRALRKADELLQEALACYPHSNILHAQRAWLRHLAGQPDEARRAAQEALRLDDLTRDREHKLASQRLMDFSSPFPAQPLPPHGETAEEVVRRLASPR